MDAGPRANGNAMYSTDLWGTDVNAILGQFFDDKLRRVYETLTEDYCERTEGTPRIRSTLEVMQIPEEYSEREPHSLFKENFALVVDDALLDLGKSFPMDKKTLLLKHLPRDIPCSNLLEVFKVPRDDPRIPLRGQNGLRVTKTATKGPPAGAFIGVYRGKSLIDLDEYKDIKFSPPGVDYLQFELEIESYTASAEHYNIGVEAANRGITFEGLDPRNPSYFSLHVCAARYGNITALVNDPSLEPMIYTNFETIGEDNTCLVEIIVGGWPCIVMFASKAINPGEELRYSYGQSFWKYVHAATKRLNAARGNGHLGDNAAGNGNGNLGGTGLGNGSIRDALADDDNVGTLVNDAVTPMRSRNPHSQPSAAAPPPGTVSDLEPTEEQRDGDDNDADADGNGADSRKRKARQEANNDEVTPVKSKPIRQQKTADKFLPKETPRQKPGQQPPPKKKKKNEPEKAPNKKQNEAEKTPLFTPTKKMMSSPHGNRVKRYSKHSKFGKSQAENGFASQEQFEAVQRLVEENPKIESGGESDGNEKVVAPVEATKRRRLSKKEMRKQRSLKASTAAAEVHRECNPATMGSEGESEGGEAVVAQPTTDKDPEIDRLTVAVETGNKALKIANTKLNSAVTLVDQIKLTLAELQPEEEKAGKSTETPVSIAAAAAAAAAATKSAAARTAKTKRMNPGHARKLKETEKQLKKALRKMEEKEELVQEKEMAVALAKIELRMALGEDEDKAEREDVHPEQEEIDIVTRREDEDKAEREEVDLEVAKLNERTAGKRPALENGPSGSGDGYGRANGNGTIRAVKSQKITASPYNENERTIGANGAGTSAAHAAAGTAKLIGKEDGVGAARFPQKTPAAAPDDDDVVDLTFDSD